MAYCIVRIIVKKETVIMARRPKRAPNRRKLTESVVRSLPPGPPVWDTLLPSFGIRPGKRSKTWIVGVVRPGKKHPVTLRIGRFPAMSLADARAAARMLLAGEAPAAPVLFGALVEEFLADGRTRSGRTLRPGSLKAYRAVLNGPAKPLHHLPISTIRRRDIAGITRKVANESGAAYAALAKAALGRFWSWLAENDLGESDPVRGSPSYAIPRRTRAFSNVEIRALWHADVDDDLALILRLLLWLGARETEIGGLCWSELSRENGHLVWRLPEQRAKNHRALTLPLARQTAVAIEAWPAIVGRDQLFGITSSAGFTGWQRHKEKLDKLLRFNREWQFRDCRRTVETGMASVGLPKDIVNRILNHGVPQMASIYDQHHYFDEKANVLQLWADQLDEIVAAD
jgi:integrase